jgi:hypothetical protein
MCCKISQLVSEDRLQGSRLQKCKEKGPRQLGRRMKAISISLANLREERGCVLGYTALRLAQVQ